MRSPLRLGPRKLLLPGTLDDASQLRINWRHPLARGLQACVVPLGPDHVAELVQNTIVVAGGGTTIRRRGPSSAGAITLPDNKTRSSAFTTGEWSVAAIGYQSSLDPSLESELFAKAIYVSETVNSGWRMESAPDGHLYIAVGNNNGGAFYSMPYTALSTIGTTMMGFATDGSASRCYINGLLDNIPSGKNVTAANTTSAMGKGIVNFGATWDLHIGCTWARRLTDFEMLLFNMDPFCLLEGPLDEASRGIANSVSIAQLLFLFSQQATCKVGPATDDQFYSWLTN